LIGPVLREADTGRWHLEALERIARAGEGFVTFDIKEARKYK